MQPPLSSPEKDFQRIEHRSQPKVFTSPPLAIEMSPQSSKEQQQQQQNESAPPRHETEPNPIIEEINIDGANYPGSPGMINVSQSVLDLIGWVSNKA